MNKDKDDQKRTKKSDDKVFQSIELLINCDQGCKQKQGTG